MSNEHEREQLSTSMSDSLFAEWQAHRERTAALKALREHSPNEWEILIESKALALFNATHPRDENVKWAGETPQLEFEEAPDVLQRLLELITEERDNTQKKWDAVDLRDEQSQKFNRMLHKP